jgi:hypothetical protein
MLELNALLGATKNTGSDDKKNDVRQTIMRVVIIVLELALFIWAIFRAIKCSQKNPDSRAVHLLFAVVSPTLYLIFSYSVEGFCVEDKNKL